MHEEVHLHGKLIEMRLEQPRAHKWQAGVLIALLLMFLGTDVGEISNFVGECFEQVDDK